jgi:hypothetical protein
VAVNEFAAADCEVTACICSDLKLASKLEFRNYPLSQRSGVLSES